VSWFSRLRNALRPDQLDSELDEELLFHAEQRGLARLPRHLQLREESREARLATWLESVMQDTRLAARLWRRRPVLALTAILTLALGAGMNVAVFQVIWNVMLKPLPYANPQQLAQVFIDDGRAEREMPRNDESEKWRQASTVTSVALFRPWRYTVTGQGDPESVIAGAIGPRFFETFGVKLTAGRDFDARELAQGDALLARASFLARRGLAMGGELNIDGMLCRIAGVVPDTFHAAPVMGSKDEPEIYLPFIRAKIGGATNPVRAGRVIIRLREGVPLKAAEQDLRAIGTLEKDRRIWLSPLDFEIGRSLRPALLALIAATACILLIACANLANLLLAQAVGRRREIAMRTALGASRWRIARQLITEALLLSIAGGVVGLIAGQWMTTALLALYPDAIPRLAVAGSNGPVYAFAFTLTVASGLLFGALPAWRESGADLRVGHSLMTRGSRRWASAMVAAQVALTTLVLASAGLLLQSFVNLRAVDTGVQTAQLITTSVSLPSVRYAKPKRIAFAQEWIQRLQNIPGVTAVGISNSLPIRYQGLLTMRDRLPGVAGEQEFGGRAVTSGYFAAMGMRFSAGGTFDPNREDQRIVNEAFVRRYLKGIEPIGAPVSNAKNPATIVGVVRDVRQYSLRKPAEPEMYLAFTRFPLDPADTAIRTTLPMAQLLPVLRRELRAIDDQLVLGKTMTMDEVIDTELARPRFHMWLLVLFASVALVLAAIGIYGVIAHHVRSRVPEFGLRRALGASTGSLFGLVLRDGLRAPAFGLALGVALAWFVAGRLLDTLLYGIAPRDPGVYAITCIVLAVAAVLACVIPGLFATRIEPAAALRRD
jgi:putative ABC transport system permease protein